VTEFGGYGGGPSETDIRINVSSGIRRLQGFMRREASGFQFVDYAEGGVIPLPAREAPAPDAGA
jgi:hypothetical protein